MLNRTLCDVLEEMRKAYETRNFSYLPGLIEEAQSMANRMEAALSDKHDLRYWEKKIKEAKKTYEKLTDNVKEE